MLNKIKSVLKLVRKNCVCVKVPNIRVAFPFKVKAQWSETRSCVLKQLLAVSLPVNYSPFFGSFSYSLRTPSPQPDTVLP